jgi:hypothetical protein
VREVRQGRDGTEGVLRPPHEEVLSRARGARALAAAVTLLVAACAPPSSLGPGPSAIAPPAPARNVPPLDDPADRVRFDCQVAVQRAQGFDPGASITKGSLIGLLLGGFVGGSLGALFGLIGDMPGASAGVGAVVGGGAGAMAGGLLALRWDSQAYARGLDACLAALRAGTRPSPAAVPDGLVEYRLRLVSLRHDAFASYLSTAELANGASGPGLMRLAAAADSGALERGVVLYDRHLDPAPEALARAFGATPVDARVRLGGGGRDVWDEARWRGRPGERTVWVVVPRMRRAQEVRRVGLSDVTALAQYQPATPGLLGRARQASVSVPLAYLRRAEERGAAGAYVDRELDGSRGIGALVAVNDDAVYPDRVYLVVTHAVRTATYEALLAWGPRGDGRDLPRE